MIVEGARSVSPGDSASPPGLSQPYGLAAALLLTVIVAFLAAVHAVQVTALLSAPLWRAPGPSAYLAVALVLGICGLLGVTYRFAGVFWSLLLVAIVALAATYAGIVATATVALQLAAGFCLGRRLLTLAAQPADEVRLRAVLATALGLALLTLAVTGMSFLPVNTPVSHFVLLLLPLLIGWRQNLQAFMRLWQACRARDSAPMPAWQLIGTGIIALALLIRLLAALRPELGADALAMHLVIADQLKTDGRFHYNASQSIWAVQPMAGDWQFATSYMLSGAAGARLLNFAIDLLLVATVYLAARGAGGRKAAMFAVLVYATTPLLYRQTSTLYVENFWSLWFVSALLLGLFSLRDKDRRLPIGAGVLLGTAMASKVITIFLLPFFLAIAMVWLWRDVRTGLRNVALAGSTALLTAFAPYLNAWVRTGNPVFPFLNDVFKSPLYDPIGFTNDQFNTPIDWSLLHDVTFHSNRYLEGLPGALGLSFYVLLPAAVLYAMLMSWRNRTGMLCSLLFVVAVFHFQSYLRYILPVIPVLAVLIGLSAGHVVDRLPKARYVLVSILLATTLANLYLTPAANRQMRELILPPRPDSPATEQYLRRRRPSYGLVTFIAQSSYQRVLWIGKPHIAGAHANLQVTTWHGGRFALEFTTLRSGPAFAHWLLANDFDGVAIARHATPCQRQFICEVLRANGHRVYEGDGASFWSLDTAGLRAVELLVNPGFDLDTHGWSGDGRYIAADHAVVVSGVQHFTQAATVKGGAHYTLAMEARCTSDRAPYRLQVNWLGIAGFIVDDAEVFECDQAFVRHAINVTAPSDAVKAKIHVRADAADKTVEVTHVSFRQSPATPAKAR